MTSRARAVGCGVKAFLLPGKIPRALTVCFLPAPPATQSGVLVLEASVGIGMIRAKEGKERLRREGAHSMACSCGVQMGKGAGPTLESPSLDFAEVLGYLYLLLCVSGCPLF